MSTKAATCPTCLCTNDFTYLGEQHWPPAIAQKMGLPEVITLWSCSKCLSTISESDLLPPQTPLPSEPTAQ